MRDMKDSGVEWIGKIPENWECCKLKRITSINTGCTPSKNEYDIFYDKKEGIPWIKVENLGSLESINITEEYLTLEGAKYARVFPKNAVYVCCIASIGKVGFSEIECSCNQQINVLLFERAYWKYGFYLTIAQENEYIHCATGNVVKILNSNRQADIVCTNPPLEEQQKIANYLDEKCAKVDAIIEKQQAIIEKLKEYKLSVITEAVTKGLNPNVEMKDSGVKCIGAIPKDWRIIKLKYLFADGDKGLKIGPFGSALRGKTLEDGSYKIYNQAHLIQNNFDLRRHFVSEETFKELQRYEIKPGDILFSMMGTVGKCQIMPKGYQKGIMDSHLLKTRLNDRILPEFFIYSYDKDYSNQVIPQLLYLSNGSIMNGLNSSLLKSVQIALPPMEEQELIVNYIKKKCKKIDSIIYNREEILKRLQELKKSLIYEVVTGKREV